MSTMREKFSQWLGANSQHVDSVTEQFMFEAWQAATEAAKATGTAGEPELPLPKYLGDDLCGLQTFGYTADQMRAYGQQCAEAARQPAPALSVDELTEHEANFVLMVLQNPGAKLRGLLIADGRWKRPEELGFVECTGSWTWEPTEKLLGILRAALAATAAPVLSDERIDWLANCACPGGIAYPSQVKTAIRDALREAATNRSQP